MYSDVRTSEDEMSLLKSSIPFISISLIAIGVVSISGWLFTADFISYVGLQTFLTVTTETLGALLGILTAGLMFTQGKFSELSSELSDRSPDYLANVLSFEKIQAIEGHLNSLRKTFKKLATTATVPEERSLYERVVAKTSSMFVNLAVFLNLKLKQQRLPITGLLVSEMDPGLYRIYEKARKSIRREWHLFDVVGKIVSVWEAPASFLTEKPHSEVPLQADVRSAISILKLKESVDESSANIRRDVVKAKEGLSKEISSISKRFYEDRIPRLLAQMGHASIVRGKYFYLTVGFISVPLFINLLTFPQLTEATATSLKPIIAATSALGIIAVLFLLLYVYKILSV